MEGMPPNRMGIELEEGDRGGKIRQRVYWALSVLATIVSLMFIYVMSVVPGVPSVQRLWMLFVAAALLVLSLGVGTWKFRTTEAPVLAWPFGTVMCLLLFLELAVCIIGMFQASLANPIP